MWNPESKGWVHDLQGLGGSYTPPAISRFYIRCSFSRNPPCCFPVASFNKQEKINSGRRRCAFLEEWARFAWGLVEMYIIFMACFLPKAMVKDLVKNMIKKWRNGKWSGNSNKLLCVCLCVSNAHIEIIVSFVVVNFFSCLSITRYHEVGFWRNLQDIHPANLPDLSNPSKNSKY